MFYEEDRLKSELSCSSCGDEYDEPKCLPCCGEVVCLSCILVCLNDPKSTDQLYKCVMCSKMEEMPRGKAFVTVKKLVHLKSLKPKEVYRSELVVHLKSALKELSSSFGTLNSMLHNGTERIDKRIDNIRTKITQYREHLFAQINEQTSDLLRRVDAHRDEIISSLTQNDSHFVELRSFASSVARTKSKWDTYLKQAVISDEEVSIGIKECEDNQKKINASIPIAMKHLFDDKWMRFVPMSPFTNVHNPVIGSLSIRHISMSFIN